MRALWTTDRLRGGKNAIVRVAAGPIMDGKWNRDVPKRFTLLVGFTHSKHGLWMEKTTAERQLHPGEQRYPQYTNLRPYAADWTMKSALC